MERFDFGELSYETAFLMPESTEGEVVAIQQLTRKVPPS